MLRSFFLPTVTPEIELAWPTWYSSAPTMSCRKPSAGELTPGASSRSSACLNVWAVTASFEAVEKWKLVWSLKV